MASGWLRMYSTALSTASRVSMMIGMAKEGMDNRTGVDGVGILVGDLDAELLLLGHMSVLGCCLAIETRGSFGFVI